MVKKLSPFHHWVNKVLPEVYDDSLSYYELLNKVVGYLNQAMSNVNTLSDNVTSIYNTVVELQDYIGEHMEESVEAALEEYFKTHDFVGTVNVTQTIRQGVEIGSITVDGVVTKLFCPVGSSVSVDQVIKNGVEIAGISIGGVRTPIFAKSVSAVADIHTGTKIGSITIGGEVVNLYAPNGGANVEFVQTLTGGVEIGTITINGISTRMYAPAGGDSVSFTPTLTTGVEVGEITINGRAQKMYAPSGQGGTGAVDSVNGKIGDVVLNANDVGAIANTEGSVAEGNIANGAVTLTKVANQGAENSGKVLGVSSTGEVELQEKGGGTGAVASVNGKTGAVVLNAGDVGAIANGTGTVSSTNIANGAVTLQKIGNQGAANSGKVLGVSSTGAIELKSVGAAGSYKLTKELIRTLEAPLVFGENNVATATPSSVVTLSANELYIMEATFNSSATLLQNIVTELRFPSGTPGRVITTGALLQLTPLSGYTLMSPITRVDTSTYILPLLQARPFSGDLTPITLTVAFKLYKLTITAA